MAVTLPETLAGHRVVLTGGSGTLGGAFLRAVEQHPGVSVLALLRPESPANIERPGVHVARPESLDRQGLHAVIRDFEPDSIVHCAATGMEFPSTAWFDLIRLNVDLTVNLCECAAAIPGCHFVHVSTGLAYRPQGRPLTEDDPLGTGHPYGASKAAADLLVRSAAAEFAVPLTLLRPFSFTGPGDDRTRLFPTLLRAAATGTPLSLSPGAQVRDHCSSRDIAAAVLASLLHPPSAGDDPHVYNLGSARTESLRELLTGIVAELDMDVDLQFGARPYPRFEPMHLVADTQRARSELGWAPRHNLAHAVWELARASFPSIAVREPREAL